MKFSIITATYNSAKTISFAIKSLQNQTYKDFEYIVIDGGSTDVTLEIIKQNKNIVTKCTSEPDNGIYDALNKGIAISTGDIIGTLHSDDVFAYPNVLQDVENIFITTKADAVYADLDYVKYNNIEKIERKWRSGKYKKDAFLNGWMPPHPTLFVKKEIYNKLGVFNLEFKTTADYELMLRFIHKHKIKLAYLPKVTVKMRMGGLSNSTLRHRIFANKEDRKAWVVNGLKPRFYTLYLKPLRKIFQYL